MKNKLILSFLVFSFLVLISSCKKNSSTEPNPPAQTGNYFPNNDGTYYKYNMQKTDSTGAQTTGTRTSRYDGTSNQNGTDYQKDIDSITIANQTVVSNSYFRTTNTGVFYFVDTTGLFTYIPDSLKSYLTVDNEMRAFYFPLSDVNDWSVFKININYLGIISFNPIEVHAYYEGMENVTLNLTTGSVTKSAEKVRYELSVKDNPFGNATNYEAYVWVVDNIGVVKWQGNGTILNAFTGGGIDFTDTTSVVTQSLVDYNIQ